jgi:outer membrane protein assembly factor BamB
MPVLRRSLGAIALLISVVVTAPEASSPVILWQHAAEGWGEPALDATTAYFLTRHHEIVALDATTGALRWRVSTGGSGEVPWGSRLLIVGAHVVAGDGAVRAFDRVSGHAAWEFTPRNGDAIGPFIGAAKGDVLFAGSPTGHVHAIDARTGRRVWSRVIAAGGRATVFPPVATAAGVVVAFTMHGQAVAGGLVGLDDRGTIIWRCSLPMGAAGGPVAANGLVAVARTDGVIVGVDAEWGSVRWQLPAAATRGGTPPERDIRPLAVSGHVLVAGSLSGELVAVDLRALDERWHYRAKEGISVLRLRADASTVYAPYTDDSVVALDAATGTELWRAGDERSPFEWPPAAAGDRVVIAGTRALVALRGIVAPSSSLEDGHD